MDTDSFVLSVNTNDIIKDLKNLENLFDFGNLNENRELFSSKNKEVFGKLKIETPKNIYFDEFFSLRSQIYSFKREDDSKNKLKCISKSRTKRIKFVKFEEYKNVYMVKNIRKNVIIMYFVQLIMEGIFNEYKNQRSLYSKTNDVMKLILKVKLGIITNNKMSSKRKILEKK